MKTVGVVETEIVQYNGIKCDGQTDVHMMKGKTICTPLYGEGHKNI